MVGGGIHPLAGPGCLVSFSSSTGSQNGQRGGMGHTPNLPALPGHIFVHLTIPGGLGKAIVQSLYKKEEMFVGVAFINLCLLGSSDGEEGKSPDVMPGMRKRGGRTNKLRAEKMDLHLSFGVSGWEAVENSSFYLRGGCSPSAWCPSVASRSIKWMEKWLIPVITGVLWLARRSCMASWAGFGTFLPQGKVLIKEVFGGVMKPWMVACSQLQKQQGWEAPGMEEMYPVDMRSC